MQTTVNSKYQYAAIVPCYNEEKRLPKAQFLDFIANNEEVLICFVNDGSKDNTLGVLRDVHLESDGKAIFHHLSENGGKAEAVRKGMNFIYKAYPEIQYIGFMDADLATKPEEWLEMAKKLKQTPRYGAIVGSRISRLGADIERDDNRSIMSKIVKTFIRIIVKAPFQDTQCGAKVFHKSLIPSLFTKKFSTPWLFDVEILLRLQEKFGQKALKKGVLEFPLQEWTEVGESKFQLKHSIKIPFQLLDLYSKYRLSKLFKTKSGFSIFESKNPDFQSKSIKNIISTFL